MKSLNWACDRISYVWLTHTKSAANMICNWAHHRTMQTAHCHATAHQTAVTYNDTLSAPDPKAFQIRRKSNLIYSIDRQSHFLPNYLNQCAHKPSHTHIHTFIYANMEIITCVYVSRCANIWHILFQLVSMHFTLAALKNIHSYTHQS